MYINISLGKQYGLLLSGGLSSSLLLYLMMKDRPTARVQPFTISNASENSILYANPIIDYFNSKFFLSVEINKYFQFLYNEDYKIVGKFFPLLKVGSF